MYCYDVEGASVAKCWRRERDPMDRQNVSTIMCMNVTFDDMTFDDPDLNTTRLDVIGCISYLKIRCNLPSNRIPS